MRTPFTKQHGRSRMAPKVVSFYIFLKAYNNLLSFLDIYAQYENKTPNVKHDNGQRLTCNLV
jgi:hypothetical protein